MMLWVGVAYAEDGSCPDPERVLFRAEQDAVSFFLSDAQRGIGEAVDALACSGPVDQPLVARLWQAQAMIWYFQDEHERAALAFAVARQAAPEVWNPDYGDQARAAFEVAAPAAGAASAIELRGADKADWVRVDGVEIKLPLKLTPGPHLVQIGHEQVARFARILDVQPETPLTVAVPAREAPAVVAALEPATVTAGPEVGPRPIPAIAEGLVAPIAQLRGGHYTDANERALRFRSEVLPIARYDLDGRVARRRYRSNPTGQVTSMIMAVGGTYGAYLMGWDATTGKNLEPPIAGVSAGVLATLAAAGAAWEVKLILSRPKRKAEVLEAVDRVVQGRAL